MTACAPLVRRIAGGSVRQCGFTLIELMVTVAVVAVFSTLAAPSFRQLIATQRVRSAGSALTESLWLARSEAIKRNGNVTFTLVNGAVGDWVVTEVLTGTTLHHQDGFASVTATNSTNPMVFTFNAHGRLSSGAGSVKLEVTAASVYRYVCVSSTGRATVQEAACT